MRTGVDGGGARSRSGVGFARRGCCFVGGSPPSGRRGQPGALLLFLLLLLPKSMLAAVGIHSAQAPRPAPANAVRVFVRALVVSTSAAAAALVAFVAGGPCAADAARGVSSVPAVGRLLGKVLRNGAAARLGDLHGRVDLVLDSVALFLAVLPPLGNASLRPAVEVRAAGYFSTENPYTSNKITHPSIHLLVLLVVHPHLPRLRHWDPRERVSK